MIMTPENRVGGTWWRPWFAPIVVALALAADYGSPAAMWTAALPLIFMAFLLSFRERTAALAVLLLSSWIGIPLAAGGLRAVDAVRGAHRAFYVRLTAQALDPGLELTCTGETHLQVIEIDGRRPVAEFEAQVAGTFAAAYNLFNASAIVKDCKPGTPALQPVPDPTNGTGILGQPFLYDGTTVDRPRPPFSEKPAPVSR
jgi:hypothetical protein